MKTSAFTLLLLFLAAGCLPTDTLPTPNVGNDERDYYIECYCVPGEPFRLTATRSLPLDETLTPDLDLPLDATIVAGDTINLRFDIFPGSGRLPYNYGSHRTMRTDVDSIFLRVSTPDRREITARDIVPAPVAIDSVRRDNNLVTIRFRVSGNPSSNYYIYILQPLRGNETLDAVSTLLDYSASVPRSVVERSLSLPEEATGARVILRGVSRACYSYQISLNEANSAQQGSIISPAPLAGNIEGANGIFTCYTEDERVVE
ncbi:MAG: DUF4249 domain-containing protein [Odoribacteraceae bacterium]|jgi:hypothetical protein|nr:DUF4249 domain-containing protein [Odoribacteraceae bacterium]